MSRFILFISLFFILYYALRFLLRNVLSLKETRDRKSEPEELVQDPYCQAYFPKRTAFKKKISGNVLHFCSKECLGKYLKMNKKGG
jgi:YHS domain-containing protein